MAAKEKDFFTQANNFIGAVASGVNSRTGLYGVSLELAKITGNDLQGPDFSLALNYSPLNTVDSGFGMGFLSGISYYDTHRGMLFLSTGDQYKVYEDKTSVVVQQQKLKSFIFKKIKENSYAIYYKNGVVEYLKGGSAGPGWKTPYEIHSDTGKIMYLEWEYPSQGLYETALLQIVYDSYGRDKPLLSLRNTPGSKLTLNILPGTAEGYRIELNFQNGLLETVLNYCIDMNNPLKWEFRYESMEGWGSWLVEATYPGGTKETVDYLLDGNAFPESANLPKLPYVSRFIRRLSNGETDSESSYGYSKTNFLGAFSGLVWSDKVDNLYGLLSDYQYYTEEHQKTIDGVVDIKYTFNSYHCQISEEKTKNSCKQEIKTEYYAQIGLSFDKQPAFFQLPKASHEKWTDPRGKKATITTTTTFDEFANPTSKSVKDESTGQLIEPSVSWSYYPPEGFSDVSSGSVCPPEPSGFKRFVKSMTQVPCSQDQGELKRTVQFSYSLPDKTKPSVILKSTETQFYGETEKLIKRTFSYDTTERELGRLLAIDEEWFAKKKTLKSRHSYKYSIADEKITSTDTFVSHDNQQLKTSQVSSRFTGRVLSNVDAYGNTKNTDYDKAGRVIREVEVSESNDKFSRGPERVRTYQYSIEKDKYKPFSLLVVDYDGSKFFHELDSLGRLLCKRVPITGKESSNKSQWLKILECEYAFGRETMTTNFDYVINDGSVNDTLKNEIRCSYDDWGRECKRASNTGVEELVAYDPINMIRTCVTKSGSLETARKEEVFNRAGLLLGISLIGVDSKPISRRTLVRDGWKRLVSDTNALGNVQTYAYDHFDRVVKITKPDGTFIEKEYVDFAAEPLVTNVTLKTTAETAKQVYPHSLLDSEGRSLGTNVFDGLGRLTRSSVGSRSWSLVYGSPADREPSTIVDPSGTSRSFTYTNLFGRKSERVQAVDITQQYSYYPENGLIKTASTAGSDIQREYYPSGYLKSEKVTTGSSTSKTTKYTWTLRGGPNSVIDACGVSQQNTFDEYGRIKAMTTSAIDVSFTYDAFSRLNGWKSTDKKNIHSMETNLDFDEVGREVSRVIKDSKYGVLQINQTWWADNKLKSRKTITPQKNLTSTVRNELFDYDKTGRLKKYSATGWPLVLDKYSNSIVEQNFIFDPYDNITSVQSLFSDKTENNASFIYGNADDPCQLTEVNNTHPSYPGVLKYEYNELGDLIKEGDKVTQYDNLGRLQRNGEKEYRYDAFNKLAKVGDSKLYYMGGRLSNEINGDKWKSFVNSVDGHMVAELHDDAALLIGTDNKLSVVYAGDNKNSACPVYTPYGGKVNNKSDLSAIGYNGEWIDAGLDGYSLGNGYRTYSPELMRFTSPDGPQNSPLGVAGINAYAYCHDDPINFSDPTGQISWKGWVGMITSGLGIGLTLITGGLAIAAASGVLATAIAMGTTGASLISGVSAIVANAIGDNLPEVARILRWVALGTGMVGFSFGTSAVVRGVSSAVRELGLRTTLGTMGVASRVNLGLTATSYVSGTISYGSLIAKRILDQTSAADSTANTVLSNISFYSGLVSDAASLGNFVLPRVLPRSYSWDVAEIPVMEEFNMRVFSRSFSWDAPPPSGSPQRTSALIKQVQNFYVFLAIPSRL
ncbi:RHS repeat-associated core domain-containing protein [Pseudomonas agarici]|uniref:RHS repeat-associated core domain-containing protein n=4 Tax=Pseudomonas agarici TaxID=46677 RepID=UPI0008C1C7B9|nr:RHS repeat-associated core domain-containing protein [Pseudomonas agarici]NWB93047.1 RHS repeat-associated core domain-containing protein [Pseudomonas agarici]NWC10100.1 RHS repeat-associated core domain-containing protein [Pseudomonas agarici]SEL71700.1 RHS repeat-associated core domain-containing protein [Pseudomonas agarici]